MARATIRKSGASFPGAPTLEGAPVVPWHMDPLAPPRGEQQAPPLPVRPPEEELARIREQARAEGHAAGLASGLAAGARDVADLAQLLGRLREVLEDHEQALAGDVMGLAVELSRQILRHALYVHPEVVLPVVREAIASLPQGSQHPRLLLHPQDAALVRSVLDANQLTPSPWRIVEDARLERGGCRIETATSELDASLGSRWRAVIAALGREERWVDLDVPQRATAMPPAEGNAPSGTVQVPAPGSGGWPREPR
ncbi:MAG: flagellar assembly protein FliH [Betaproteobacteria bacterium]|jgi:flagellar assembly protein FliH|nr:flagellar assembly protein FliH [Betaproteobacteria bacterium]